jgi:hypothetical protein
MAQRHAPALQMLLALWVCVFASARSLSAQGPPRIDITPSSTPSAPTVAIRDVLGAKPFEELLRNGFPTRLHVRAELWTSGRWFDELFARDEWDLTVSYDLIERTFDVARRTEDRLTSLGSYSNFTDARAASELAFTPTLRVPGRGRRGYVAVQVDVQTVSISDIDEMRRWLRGEAQPAVQGKRNPGSALGSGLRTLVTRMLGGEVRHLEQRTPTIIF